MKKALLLLSTLFALVGLVCLTSCKKDEISSGTQFRATMEGCSSTKTSLSGTSLNWVAGDQIVVYGNNGRGIYTALLQTSATTSIFDYVSGETGSAPYRAYYPSTLTTDGVSVTLPATQTYVEGSINEFPMYAESSDNLLAFKNLCGVLKLHLTKANTNISSIVITATDEINGQFALCYNGGSPTLRYVDGGVNATTLTCSNPQSIALGKDFYVYLPVGSYSGLRIEMVTDNGFHCVKTSHRVITIARSQYTTVTLDNNDLSFRPVGSKGELFSVSPTLQVWFSQGNLQYQVSTGVWRFAENQYDYVGVDNDNIRNNGYLGWIDLFGWGTGNNPTKASQSYENYTTFVDWGINAIENGGNQENLWRSLTISEWYYILFSRNNASGKIGSGTVVGKHGIILLPDRWTLPDNYTFVSEIDSWDNNVYNFIEWTEMESNGAIFLPAAGYRWGTYIYGMGYGCEYWSSSGYSGREAGDMCFFLNQLDPDEFYEGNYRFGGFSIRLIREDM